MSPMPHETREPLHTTERLAPDAGGILRAARLLQAGELVAFPTETVYGLGARIDDPAAIARLFRAKGRPTDNPLIVHVADRDALIAVTTGLTPLADLLLQRLSPGPLTVVLDAHPDLSPAVTGGLDTVAVRIPDHPVALALLRATALAVAAPSANRSTRPSPTSADHVLTDLAGDIAAVIDGGPTRVGLESTVVDARGDLPVVLRDGGVSREDLAATTGCDLSAILTGDGRGSPGRRYRHYAPDLTVHVTPGETAERLAVELARTGRRVGLLTHRPSGERPVSVTLLRVFEDAADLAAHLFDDLRAAEHAGLDAVVVAEVERSGIGRAVMDRLDRAARATRPAPDEPA